MAKDLSVLFTERTNQQLPAHRIYIDLTVGGELTVDGQEVNADIAPVKYQYKYWVLNTIIKFNI